MDNNKEQAEIKIRKMIAEYIDHSPYKLNPDTKITEKIGSHFDPYVGTVFMEHYEKFCEIRNSFQAEISDPGF